MPMTGQAEIDVMQKLVLLFRPLRVARRRVDPVEHQTVASKTIMKKPGGEAPQNNSRVVSRSTLTLAE